jgi:hypothetical protein
MTIACTRCGATCDGDIILPALAFGFKHNSGCGHGVGPLAVLPGFHKKASVSDENKKIFKELEKEDVKVEDTTDVIVEETPKKSKSKIEKLKVFGKKD